MNTEDMADKLRDERVGNRWSGSMATLLLDAETALRGIDRESDSYKLGIAEMDARKWHETCETLMTMAGLSPAGSPQEMLTEFQRWLGS